MNLHESIESINQAVGEQQWLQVVSLCESALETFPQTLELYCFWGKALERLKQIDQAIVAYQQSLQYHPSEAIIHAELGRLYCQQKQFPIAISHYQQTLKTAPQWADVNYNLGVIFHQQGQWQQASTYYQRTLASNREMPIDPEANQKSKERQARAYFGLGVVQGHMGYPALAMSCYQKAIQSNPSHWPSYKNLAYLLSKREAYEQALQLYHQALDYCDEKAAIYANLGRVYSEQDQITEAVVAYETANELDPELAIAHYDLGKLWLRYQHYPQANRAFQKAAELDFSHTAIASIWGPSLLEQGEWHQALELFQQSIALQSDWIKSYCQQATQLSSDNAFNRVRIACAHLLDNLQRTDDVATAIPYLGKVYETIADLFYESQIFDRAEAPLQKALWINPHQPERSLKLGQCLTEQQRWDEAIAIYHAALMATPSHAKLQNAYDSLLQRRQQVGLKFYPSQILQGIYAHTADWVHTGSASPTLSILSSWYSLFQPIDWSLDTNRARTAPKQQPPNPPLPLTRRDQQTASSPPSAEPCGGVTCSRCMGSLIDSFHPIQLAPDIYQCSTQNNGIIPPHEAFVATLPQGRAWIAPRRNAWLVCNEIAIITADNYLLGDLSRFYPWYLPGCQNHVLSHHGIGDRHDIPLPTVLNGNVAVLSSLSGNVYYHWMIDVLPRIGILQKSQWSLDHIDWFVVNSLNHSFQTETLTSLGIPLEKVIESDRISHIKAQNLIVPSFPGHLDWVSSGTMDFLRHAFLPNPGHSLEAGGQRIYISRANAKYRKVLNEDAVIDCLKPLGFRVVELEGLSVAQQAQLFAQAEVILSPHGSSLTNLVFCQPDTTVIELFTPHYIRTDYWMISQHLNLNHYYMICQDFTCYPLRQLMYQTPLTEDIYVEIDQLQTCLQLVLAL